jgi:hypothetical protein
MLFPERILSVEKEDWQKQSFLKVIKENRQAWQDAAQNA